MGVEFLDMYASVLSDDAEKWAAKGCVRLRLWVIVSMQL